MVEGNDVLLSPERIKELSWAVLRDKGSLPHWPLLRSGLSSSAGIVLSSDNTTTTGNLHGYPILQKQSGGRTIGAINFPKVEILKPQGRPPACSWCPLHTSPSCSPFIHAFGQIRTMVSMSSLYTYKKTVQLVSTHPLRRSASSDGRYWEF